MVAPLVCGICSTPMKAGKSFRTPLATGSPKPHYWTSNSSARRLRRAFWITDGAATPNARGEVTDVLFSKSQRQISRCISHCINPNYSSYFLRPHPRCDDCSFISIWVMVILGAVFNALTITKPIKELLVVSEILHGNFKQRINLPLGGELKDLISSFNEMAERLELWRKNIEELTAEKAKLETLVSTIADGAICLIY